MSKIYTTKERAALYEAARLLDEVCKVLGMHRELQGEGYDAGAMAAKLRNKAFASVVTKANSLYIPKA